MPPQHEQYPDQKPLSSEPTHKAAPQSKPDMRLIQRALANPNPQTLLPSVLVAMRQMYSQAFVQRLVDQPAANNDLPDSTPESLDQFLSNIQSARSAPPVQAKLTVTPAGDQYEQEADAVAQQVVQRLNAPTLATTRTVQPVQRTEDDEDELQRMRDTGLVQRQTGDGMGGLDVQPDVEARIHAAQGSGSPIPEGSRSQLEGAFGADFSGVRVHTDSESDALNRSVQARAFTTGKDIFFRQGEYNPGSSGGQELLAHELTHVVQQNSHLSRKTKLSIIQRQILSNIEPAEDDLFIKDVKIGGRSVSPFSGTMGAHSTAWIAHIDVIRRMLIGNSLDVALDWLLWLIEEKLELSIDKDLLDNLDENHRAALANTRVRLEGLLSESDKIQKDIKHQIGAKVRGDLVSLGGGIVTQAYSLIQQLINQYLTFVNYLPMTTVKGGDSSGHGEGTARGQLNFVEYVMAKHEGGTLDTDEDIKRIRQEVSNKPKDFRRLVLGAFDNGNKIEELRTKLIKLLWTLFAPETSGVFAGDNQQLRLKAWQHALQSFIKTIRLAYPYTFNFTGMNLAQTQREGLEARIQGLDAETKNAVITNFGDDKSVDFGKTIAGELKDVDPAQPRKEAVAPSDIVQAATGFQAVVVLDEDNDTIAEIEMIGRTKSPFSGTMGAHTTAWAAHLDAVRNRLTRKSLNDAINWLLAESKEVLHDDSLSLSSQLDDKHKVRLVEAYNILNFYNELAPSYFKDTPVYLKAQFLQEFIEKHLSFVNFLPLSTIKVGKVPGGRSEGRHRNFLLSYETYGAKVIPEGENLQDVLLEHLLGLYEGDVVGEFKTSTLGKSVEKFDLNKYFFAEGSEKLQSYGPSHGLHTHMTGNDTTSNKQELSMTRFLNTVYKAYPRAVTDSGLLTQQTKRHLDRFQKSQQQVQINEQEELSRLVTINNCLINAILRAHFDSDEVNASYEQLLAIRLRVGEIGRMLLATPAVVNVILEVLGINRGVVVIYPNGPSEDIGDTSSNPILIHHTGHNHFEPGSPPQPSPSTSRNIVPYSSALALLPDQSGIITSITPDSVQVEGSLSFLFGENAPLEFVLPDMLNLVRGINMLGGTIEVTHQGMPFNVFFNPDVSSSELSLGETELPDVEESEWSPFKQVQARNKKRARPDWANDKYKKMLQEMQFKIRIVRKGVVRRVTPSEQQGSLTQPQQNLLAPILPTLFSPELENLLQSLTYFSQNEQPENEDKMQ